MKIASAALVVAALGAPAFAQPTFFVSKDTTLMRFQLGGGIDSFTMSDRIRGLTARADDTLFAVSPVNPDNGEPEFYEINNPFDALPVLTPTSVQTNIGWSAVTEVGNLLYALGGDGDLYSIDPGNAYAPTFIGYTGLTDVGGLAYDAPGNRLVALDNDSDALYALNWATGNADITIGSLGIDSTACGIELFGGVLYAAIQNVTDDELQVGTVSLSNGSYTSIQTLESGAILAATSLAIIPAPGTLALLVSAVAIGARRRR